MKLVLKKNPLYESFDFENEDINIESEIPIYRYKKFLEDTYDISGSTKFREVDGKFIVDVNGSVRVENKAITSLVEGNLEFGYVSGNFFCTNCNNLISLKGAPKIVKGGFYCWECDSLKTLEGAPKSVFKEFSCSYCPSLETLEGGPKFVAGIYACMGCDSLTTLKGAPDFVGSDFTCKGCNNLISFEGMPKEIKGKFRSGKLKKIKLTESFDFNSEEDEDFDEIISSSKWFALIKKAVQESVEISIEKNVPGKIFPYAIRENTKKLSTVIKPLRNLIKIVNPSNDVILNFQLDHPLGGVQISYWIKEGPNKLNTYIDSIYPAAPMYIGEFIYKIYLAVLHNFGLIRNLSEFTTMIKEETKILYSL